jgi:hypothetical protein
MAFWWVIDELMAERNGRFHVIIQVVKKKAFCFVLCLCRSTSNCDCVCEMKNCVQIVLFIYLFCNKLVTFTF